MRKSTFTFALILLAVVAWFGLQGSPPRAADAVKPVVQKFDYLQRNWLDVAGRQTPMGSGQGDPRGLNELGDKGWELCGVIGAPPQSVTVVFKRPKQ
jgi:hypothetical protein